VTVLRADAAAGRQMQVHGAAAVAGQALAFSPLARLARPVLVNGAAGIVVASDVVPLSILGFTVRGGKIVEIDILADSERLRRLQVASHD
jgi:RNA polymerase sigma-70 factor (ECF subfamily)